MNCYEFFLVEQFSNSIVLFFLYYKTVETDFSIQNKFHLNPIKK